MGSKANAPRLKFSSLDVVNHKMPESFNAFCNIVSFTAAKTSLILDVSVACVRLS